MGMRDNRIGRRPFLLGTAAAFAGAAGVLRAGAAQAEWAPERAVEIVVPSNPGGGLDVAGRSLQAVLDASGLLGVPTVVVNKPGAGTTLGLVYLNEHEGDGNFIEIQAPPMVTNAIMGLSDIDIDDVTPLALLVQEEIVFSALSSSRFGSGADLIAALKADPQAVSIGISSALGAHSHLAVALLMQAIGGDPKALKVVVFGSGAEAATAVLGGHIDIAITPASSILGHVEAGTLRVLGIPAEKRAGGALADVPTWKEQGADFAFANWRFVIGPKGLSPDQIAFWDGVLGTVAAQPDWQESAQRNLWTPDYRSSADLAAFLAEQRAKLAAILQDLGMVG
jgi:putative tricarboxylic transport membrane protein